MSSKQVQSIKLENPTLSDPPIVGDFIPLATDIHWFLAGQALIHGPVFEVACGWAAEYWCWVVQKPMPWPGLKMGSSLSPLKVGEMDNPATNEMDRPTPATLGSALRSD